MPAEDAEPVDTTDAEDAELLVADPEDYHETQRLREIHEARRTVHDAIRHGETHEIQRTVAAYGMELRPLIRELDDFDTSIPHDELPWDDLREYLDMLSHSRRSPQTSN